MLVVTMNATVCKRGQAVRELRTHGKSLAVATKMNRASNHVVN